MCKTVSEMDAAGPGGLGGTFGGNPVSITAALAVLDQMETGAPFARAEAIGRAFAARAEGWRALFPMVGDTRGLGAMRAIELVKDRETREPAKEATTALTEACYRRGLITITAGTYGNVIRTLMPLVITDEELEEGLDVLEAALGEVGRTVLTSTPP